MTTTKRVRPRQSGKIQFVCACSSNGTSDSKGGVKANGRVALDRACDAIVRAPNGAQESTLHRKCYGIGSLIAGSALTYPEAVSRLCEAARRMPAYRGRWLGLERKIEASVRHGIDRPWQRPSACWKLSDPPYRSRLGARRRQPTRSVRGATPSIRAVPTAKHTLRVAILIFPTNSPLPYCAGFRRAASAFVPEH